MAPLNSGIIQETLAIDKTKSYREEFNKAHPDISPEELKRIVLDKYLNDPNSDYYEKLMRSNLFLERAGDGKLGVLFDSKKRDVSIENLKVLYGFLSFSKMLKSFRENNLVYCKFEYNPFKNSLYYTDNNDNKFFNTYNPPFWKEEFFFSGNKTSLPKEQPLPEVYNKFLSELTDFHKESQNYILDWIANAIRSRNHTVLTCLGEEGIGKGILGEILGKIFEDNYQMTTDKCLTSNFNGEFENKQLIQIDELNIKNNKAAINRLKGLINPKINVEQKYVTRKSIRNHASIYITSNDLDALTMGLADRRFSVINLTDTQMIDRYSDIEIGDLYTELLEKDNIKCLVGHLLNRHIKFNMNKPFKQSETFKKVKYAGFAEWERFIMDHLAPKYAGKRIPIKTLQADINNNFPNMKTPGILKIADFGKKSGLFERNQDKKSTVVDWAVFKNPPSDGDSLGDFS